MNNPLPIVEAEVLKAFPNVTADQLRSRNRFSHVANVRMAFCYVARETTELTVVEIGEFITRNYGTVIHGHKRISELMSIDAKMNEQMTGVVGVLRERFKNGAAPPLEFVDAIRIAKGCFDYSGGHRNEARETFHHGIQTVVNALEAAQANGMTGLQERVLHAIGGAK